MSESVQSRGAPRVSVIIPVKDDAARLTLCLEALMRQSLPAGEFEIVVVDNGSTRDDPRAVVARFPGVRLEKETGPGPAAARNRGLAASRGRVIAFTDADCLPEPDWLEEGLKALAALPKEGMVGGRVIAVPRDPERPTALEWFDRIYYFDQETCLSRWHFALTANLFVSRAVVEAVGVFDVRFQEAAGEDVDFGQRVWRAGGPQAYAAEAVVRHPAMNDPAAFWRRQERAVRTTYGERPAEFRRLLLDLRHDWPGWRQIGGALGRTEIGRRSDRMKLGLLLTAVKACRNRIRIVLYWEKCRRGRRA
jgi:GT2 family glycosyltransferase